MKIAIILILLVALVSGCCITGDCVDDFSEREEFAKFLTNEGISMAGLETCPHCLEQKAEFGDAFEFVTYYDCAIERDWCSEKGISSVPAWVFPDGTVYVGSKTLDELKEMTNY
jgi:hypothetical protein